MATCGTPTPTPVPQNLPNIYIISPDIYQFLSIAKFVFLISVTKNYSDKKSPAAKKGVKQRSSENGQIIENVVGELDYMSASVGFLGGSLSPTPA